MTAQVVGVHHVPMAKYVRGAERRRVARPQPPMQDRRTKRTRTRQAQDAAAREDQDLSTAAPKTRKYSEFQPIVVVEGEHIDIDWSGSQTASYVDSVEQDDTDDTDAHTLDDALGPEDLSMADRLRRLADYMDAHPKAQTDG